MYTETHRFYRYQHQAPKGWESFQVKYRGNRSVDQGSDKARAGATEAVLSCRVQLENYITSHADFLRSLAPLPDDPVAPPLVRRMLKAANGRGRADGERRRRYCPGGRESPLNSFPIR